MYLALAAFQTVQGVSAQMQGPEATMAMCLFGEARGSSVSEKVGVAKVLLNRANAPAGRFYPGHLRGYPLAQRVAGVALQPWQFSCFNANDPNAAKLVRAPMDEPEAWMECVAVAAAALDGCFRDPTGGANHYISYTLLDYAKGKWPDWASPGKESAVVGRFRFFKLA